MDISADLTRIALAENGELMELYYESKRDESLVGNLYAGRVANVMTNLQAAFVDGDNEAMAQLCRKTTALLAERNRLCKLNKN